MTRQPTPSRPQELNDPSNGPQNPLPRLGAPSKPLGPQPRVTAPSKPLGPLSGAQHPRVQARKGALAAEAVKEQVLQIGLEGRVGQAFNVFVQGSKTPLLRVVVIGDKRDLHQYANSSGAVSVTGVDLASSNGDLSTPRLRREIPVATLLTPEGRFQLRLIDNDRELDITSPLALEVRWEEARLEQVGQNAVDAARTITRERLMGPNKGDSKNEAASGADLAHAWANVKHMGWEALRTFGALFKD